MYFGSVVKLLDAIGHDRHVRTALEQSSQRNGTVLYTATAYSHDGEIWRSCHADRLLAVVMLERLIKQTTGEDTCEDYQNRPVSV